MSQDRVVVSVDFDRCDGNGLCALEAPEIFEMDENDDLLVLQESVRGADVEVAEMAARMCPKQAITVADAGGAG